MPPAPIIQSNAKKGLTVSEDNIQGKTENSSAEPRTLVDSITDARAALNVNLADPGLARFIESVLKHETRPLIEVAALLVGVDAHNWPASKQNGDRVATAADDDDTTKGDDSDADSQRTPLSTALKDVLGVLGNALGADSAQVEVRVADGIALAERSAVPLPTSLSTLYAFIQKTAISAIASQPPPFAVPGLSLAPETPGVGGAPHADGDMVTLLGAALNIVANFRADAVNTQGLVDPQAIAETITSKSVRWFGERALPYSRQQIAEILDRWLC